MFVFLLYECVHPPYNFQSSFCRRVMISCSIYGFDELYFCEGFCVIHHAAYGLRIARISLNLQIWSFCGKGNATNPHMWILLPINFGILYTPPFSKLEVWSLDIFPLLLFPLSSRCRSWRTWRWAFQIMSSPRLSSRNCSPDSVLSKDPLLFCSWTLSSDVCRRCCRCCFSRRPGFTRIVKATVSRCTLEDSSSVQRCSNLVSLTRDNPRWAVKIRNTDYRSCLPFRAMTNCDS